MTWTSKIEKAIEYAANLDELDYIEDKIYTSEKRPDYRKKENREIRDELLNEVQKKAQLLIDKGELPFYDQKLRSISKQKSRGQTTALSSNTQR